MSLREEADAPHEPPSQACTGHRSTVPVAVAPPIWEAGGTPGALVVVTEPDAPLQVPEGLLRDLYGLTPAEARLAASLAAGRTLQEHAEAEGTATGTARWRLKQVFAKTETRRQAELAALVLRSVALVDPAP